MNKNIFQVLRGHSVQFFLCQLNFTYVCMYVVLYACTAAYEYYFDSNAVCCCVNDALLCSLSFSYYEPNNRQQHTHTAKNTLYTSFVYAL